MKNRIVTISLRAIKNNIRRFISLSILSFLGVTVFAGIKLASPNMMKTLDTYYDENDIYDLSVISTLGLTDNDVSEINKLDDVITAYGTHSKDVQVKSDKVNTIIKIQELTKIGNNIILLEGKLPENNNEIVVEKAMIEHTSLNIGDIIEIELEDNDETVNSKKLKIVGTITCPIYLTNGLASASRGSTTLGNGKINYYTFTISDFFNMDYYTEIYINVANNYETNSKEYNQLIDEIHNKLEEIKERQEQARYNDIVDKANKEIDEKEQEALNEFDDVKEQLDNANIQLHNGYKLLNSGSKQLKEYKDQLDNAFNAINDGYVKISQGETELSNAKQQLDSGISEINNKLSEYNLTYNDLLAIKKVVNGKDLSKSEMLSIIPSNLEYYNEIVEIVNQIYDNGHNEIINSLINSIDREKVLSIVPTSIDNYDQVVQKIRTASTEEVKKAAIACLLDTRIIDKIKSRIPENIPERENWISLLDSYKNKIDELVKALKAIDQIQSGYEAYNQGINTINSYKAILADGYNQYLNYLNQYNSALSEVNSGYAEYAKNYKLYQTNLEEYNLRKFDFEQNIKDAREKVRTIEIAKWFIYTRKDNNDYASYLNSVESVDKLSRLFPVVFFAVAIFISLLSMSRMAIEDRGEIGTLKSLGFSNMQIRYKYILYSLLATIIGGILGSIFGALVLPQIIFKAYLMLYDIPIFVYSNNLIPVFIGLILSILSICGATIITINSLVKEKTTELLRPRAPLKGKQILLEKIKFIWNKLSFSNKVTTRNIFRYKKRVLMTILGIVGCTILLLSGYAIRDSIVNVVSTQYADVFKYDESIYLNDNLSKDEIDTIIADNHISQKIYTKITTIESNDRTINLVVPYNKDTLNNLIVLKDKDTNQILKLEKNKIVITSKLAKLLKLKVNDEFSFIDINNNEHKFTISGIAQNYLSDFVYMDKQTYEDNIDSFKINMAYIKFDNLDYENDVINKILKNENVLGASSTQVSLKNISDIFTSLDSIVIILIVFSGALSFVVLYNLSYINISERQREIATLKVLGFTHKEVDNYILKEEIIITIIGIIIGLIVGTWFSLIIVETIEIDMVEFIKNITTLSYLKSLGFMLLFSIIVNIRVHFTLNKINMIESLKSIE